MKLELDLAVCINEDGQLRVQVDAPAVDFTAARVFTRADTLAFAVAIIGARRDVDWPGVLAELAKKRSAT